MKHIALVIPLVLAFAPFACAGGGDMRESQMQPVRTSDRPPSETDPSLHVNVAAMEAGADPSSARHDEMPPQAAAMDHDAGMKMDASAGASMGPMAPRGEPHQPHGAVNGRAMPPGKPPGMKMDAGMAMDAMPPMPPGMPMPMPMPHGSSMPTPPMGPMGGHEGHM